MKGIILLEMFKKEAEQDISHWSFDEVENLKKIQREMLGRKCESKWVFIEEEV